MQPITAQQFSDTDGVADWRAADGAAHVRYAIPTFADGARFVVTVAELADALHHHPDVDLRYGKVDIRLTTHETGGLSDRDVELAQRISAAARAVGLQAETSER